MASFKARTGWKRLKKRENKNYGKKKNKKTPLWLLFKSK